MSHRALHTGLAALLVLATALASPTRAQVTETSVTLAWTAPGDDDMTGTATRYDLRWSLTPIATLSDFSQATPVPGLPAPQPAGSNEVATVTGLTPGTTYWFAVRTLDEAGNISGLSNIVSVATLASTDDVRPAPVPLSLVTTTNSSVTVSWTDVGDDSLTGTASSMELRWSTALITEANWASATVVSGVPAPGAPGTSHQKTITGLDRTRDLWFGARAHDDVNRVSGLATPLMVPHLLDTAAPAAPAGLGATVQNGNTVRVTWTANSEPDLAGYHVYRALAAGGTYTRLTTSIVTTNEYLDTNPPDTTMAWYAVTAVDATGNESARSAPFRVVLQGTGIAAWSAMTPYPNPSRMGTPVTIPIEVPGAGPYDATVEIQDAAGQHVRSLRITNAPPGVYPLSWDGLNDSGRATTPGLYRVWLRAGDERHLVRFVRTP